MKTMKKINLYISIMAALFFFGACSNDDNDDNVDKAPTSVTNVKATSDYGSVGFTWTNPADVDFSYVEISYVNHLGAILRADAEEGAKEAIVSGFVDTKAFVFNLTAVDNDGNRSEPTTVDAAPNSPAHQVVMETIVVDLVNQEVVVAWTNETGKAVTLVVQYTDAAGEIQKKDVDAFQTSTASITDLSSENPIVSIYAMDDHENETDLQEFTINLSNEEKLVTDKWTVHDFSSEEPAEGGGNGLVTAAFDGDLGTFWHSAWNESAPDYPHHFAINMGETKTVNAFECSRRQGDERGPTKIQFMGSADGENWTDLGTFDFDADSDAAQRFDITPTDMQYFKYVALEGNDTFAFLAEINVYVNK